MDTHSPLVSFVIPCYRAESLLTDTLQRLCAHLDATPAYCGSYEILVVDDGSPAPIDSAALPFAQVQVIRLERNKGKGAAVRAGMLAAAGRFRFFMDADAPYALDAIPLMLDYLDRKEFDVVIGARDLAGPSGRIKRSPLRRAASAAFTGLVSRLVVTGVKDTQCGLKGFRGEAAAYLFSQARTGGFAFDVEILYLAYKSGLDVKRLPVRLVQDDYSTVSVFRHGLPMLRDVCALPIRYYAGRYRIRPKAYPHMESE